MDGGDSRAALLGRLDEVVTYCAAARGLAAALLYDADPPDGNGCAALIEEAGEPLLRRAVRDGSVAEDVTIRDLVTVNVGIVLATENRPDPGEETRRLFRRAVTGIQENVRPVMRS